MPYSLARMPLAVLTMGAAITAAMPPAAHAAAPALSFGTVTMPQGPMSNGSALAANRAANGTTAEAGQVAVTSADEELPPLYPDQQPITDTAPAAPARAVLSLLDGTGPLPALRPVSAMVEPSATNPSVASAREPAATTDLEDPAPAAAPQRTEPLTAAIIVSLKRNPEIQLSLAQQDHAK